MKTITHLTELFSPISYTLSLNLSNAEQRIFSGVVTMRGVAKSARENILLHSKELEIISATIDGKAAAHKQIDEDTLELTPQRELTAGKHVVMVQFSGTITDGMHGLYPCYFTHNGEKKELFATQFESHHAREVFPCIDEPAAKATFDVILTTKNNVNVLSNMPARTQNKENDTLVTYFETTPKMSSYLLAFVVGELQKKTATTRDGVEVSVWATPVHDTAALDFALETAVSSIEFFNDYFATPYPLPKSDHVALPDFSSGAMENWGLITYRESCLLAEPNITAHSSRRMIATVIAHELSHQWFGNLVTMKWWNDLWLNESFANLMEYIAIDALQPAWNMWEEFATNEVTAALRRDSLDGVQPVQTEVNHPDEIHTLFDPAIVYAKGGRLLYMLKSFIGDKAFRDGLRYYFSQFAYQNTSADDLWNAMERASQKPIRQFMQTWISQPGLPLVRVSRDHNDNNQVTISQQRFFIGEHSEDDAQWSIPLFSPHPKVPTMLDTLTIQIQTDAPIILNKNLAGHFVAQYQNQRDMRTLIAALENGELSTLDAICLLQDATLLARAGEQSSAKLLPLSLALKYTKNEALRRIAAQNLAELRKFVRSDEQSTRLLKNITKMFARPAIKELGLKKQPRDTPHDEERRASAIALAAYGEDEAVLDYLHQTFEKTALADIDPEIRATIISSVVHHHENPQLIASLLKQYEATNSSDIQADICAGLTATKNPETTATLLQEIIKKRVIRPQDAAMWFVYLVRSPEVGQIAWAWLKEYWDWIEHTFKGDKSYDDFVRYSASGLMNEADLADFRAFFADKKQEVALARAIAMGETEISGRAELIARDKAAVVRALNEYSA